MKKDLGTQLLEIIRKLKKTTPVFKTWSSTHPTVETKNYYYTYLEEESMRIQKLIGAENIKKYFGGEKLYVK